MAHILSRRLGKTAGRLVTNGLRSAGIVTNQRHALVRTFRASTCVNVLGHRASSTATQKVDTHPELIDHAVEQAIDPHHDLPIAGYDEKTISVGWGGGASWSRYHNIWLRDHCRCPSCYHPITKQRLVDTFEIQPDIEPTHVESKLEGLEVVWPSSPPHVSLYPWSWLKTNSYDPPNKRKESDEQILWGAGIQSSPPKVSFDEVMKDNVGLLKWLRKIKQFGFCFVEGVPANPEDTESLSRQIGLIRETQYGGFWDFTSNLAHGDTAYTNLALKAHTDNTYYTDPSGLQLFHLLSHTEGKGGATLLVDGFYVASILRELNPQAYEVLTRVRVQSHAAGDPSTFYKPGPHKSGYPILNLDPATGELIQVRYNNDDRSVMNDINACSVEEWYEALRAWNKCLTSPDSEYWVQLSPGTAVVVDNYRVLHGRSAFTGKRRMCGAYIGADEFRSKLLVLEELAQWRVGGINGLKDSNESFESGTIRSVWDPRL
ncbi:hypothetical protein FRC02_008168 [Tulasnella sp. 418]|nr:hypothetical protein FRC02_008168 [Tulasnella sp. 418]